MTDRLKGKVCIITGIGSGMGRAAALLFAKEGAKVVGCDINAATAQATLEAVRGIDGKAVSLHPCDMSKRSDVDKLMDFAVSEFGGIDVLYNNASMAYFDWFPQMTYEAWSKTLREELDVVFHGCQAVFPHMVKRGGGSIINVGSTSGKVAYQVLPGVAHMAAKGGVIAMTSRSRWKVASTASAVTPFRRVSCSPPRRAHSSIRRNGSDRCARSSCSIALARRKMWRRLPCTSPRMSRRGLRGATSPSMAVLQPGKNQVGLNARASASALRARRFVSMPTATKL